MYNDSFCARMSQKIKRLIDLPPDCFTDRSAYAAKFCLHISTSLKATVVASQMLRVKSRKCSYDRFTKVNTKSHNRSFHPYNLLSSQPGCCPHSLSQLHNLHLQTPRTHTYRHTHIHKVPGARYKYYTSYSHSTGKFPFSLDLS